MKNSNIQDNIVFGSCLDLDVRDSFFDVFRKNYDGFNVWFKEKCQLPNREVFYIKKDNKIIALCVIKGESLSSSLDNSILKICSFKVVDNKYSLGSQLLSVVRDYAHCHSFKFMYATTTDINLPISKFLIKRGFNCIMEDFDNNSYFVSLV
jgi:hypothetical protein